jgi:hypothetical protein
VGKQADDVYNGFSALVYVPKLVLTLVLLGEDLFRLGAGLLIFL